MEKLFSSCLALVQRDGARARWTRTVVFLPFSGHIVVSSFVIAPSVVVSCATDLMKSLGCIK